MSEVEITVVGNVVADPTLRFTQTGKPVTNFSVAVNRKRGEEEHVSFFDCTAWDTLAENAAESVAKGTRVIVQGRMEQQFFEVDGVSRNKMQIVARSIGPDLLWATASVKKNEKKDGGTPTKRTEGTAPAREGGYGSDESMF